MIAPDGTVYQLVNLNVKGKGLGTGLNVNTDDFAIGIDLVDATGTTTAPQTASLITTISTLESIIPKISVSANPGMDLTARKGLLANPLFNGQSAYITSSPAATFMAPLVQRFITASKK